MDVKIFHGLCVVVVLTACTPKRDNPLDLKSPDFQGYSISGTVERIYNGGPIPGAEVILWPVGRIAETDSAGAYAFAGLEPGDYLLQAQAEGYASDSLDLSLDDAEGEEATFLLDALPTLSASRVTTHIINNDFPEEDIIYAEARTRAHDPDGLLDIDTVFVILEADTFGLSYQGDEYMATIPAEELPGGTLESLLGFPLRFEVRDLSGHSDAHDQVYATRVVSNYARPNSPIGGATVSPEPLLTWRPTFAEYPVHFDLRVYRIELGLPEILGYEEDSLPGDSLKYQVQVSLEEGFHYWVIWTVDELGNSARSQPALFYVQP